MANPANLIIEVFSKPYCKYCDMAISLLERNNLEFEIKDILEDQHAYNELMSRTHGQVKTVPQVYIDGYSVGGYAELSEWIKLNIN